MKLLPLIGFTFFSITTLSIQQSKPTYTTQEAQQCFHSKALPSCEQTINDCLTVDECSRQLHFFHDCNFEKEFPNQVFNGNCFKNWKNTALHSKEVINCLNKECNLAQYNSDVSLAVLYSCTTEALFHSQLQCDQECQQKLTKTVSQKISNTPVKQIYELTTERKADLNNENAQKIIEIVRKQCVDENGQTRIRHEKELQVKKVNKQKMMDRMNKRVKKDEFLQQGLSQDVKQNQTVEVEQTKGEL